MASHTMLNAHAPHTHQHKNKPGAMSTWTECSSSSTPCPPHLLHFFVGTLFRVQQLGFSCPGLGLRVIGSPILSLSVSLSLSLSHTHTHTHIPSTQAQLLREHPVPKAVCGGESGGLVGGFGRVGVGVGLFPFVPPPSAPSLSHTLPSLPQPLSH